MTAVEWVWAVPFLAACVLPGLGAVTWITRRWGPLTAAEVAALSFSLTVAAVSLVATIVWLLNGSLDVVILAWVVLAIAGGVGTALLASHPPAQAQARLECGWSGLALAAGAGVLAMVERPWFSSSSDVFYHLAAVRDLVRSDAVFIQDPMYGTKSGLIDPLSGIWHTMQAAFARPLHIDPATLYLSALGVGAFVLVACVWSLMRRVAGSDRIADAMTLVLVVSLYSMDLRTFGYDNEVSLGMALLLIALLALAAERRHAVYAYIAGAVGFATVTMHLGSGELAGLAAGVFAFWTLVMAWLSRRSRDPVPLRSTLWPLATAALTFVPALPVLLPRLQALRGSIVIGGHMAVLIQRDLVRLPLGLTIMVPGGWLGPAYVFWIGVAALVWALVSTARSGDRRALGALATVSLPVLLLTNPLVTPMIVAYSAQMARRLAVLFQFTPYVGIAWVAGRVLETSKAGKRVFLLVAALAAGVSIFCGFVWGYVPSRWPSRWSSDVSIISAWGKDVRIYWGAGTLTRVKSALAEARPPVVAGPPGVVYQLTGMADVRALSVPDAHSTYRVEATTGPERRADANRMVDPSTPEAERAAIAAKWGARFVVFDDAPQYEPARAQMLADPSRFVPVVVTDRLTLLRVVR